MAELRMKKEREEKEKILEKCMKLETEKAELSAQMKKMVSLRSEKCYEFFRKQNTRQKFVL